jgi:hypothetical protein
MDPITLILTALASGAPLVAKGVAGEVIKDAYNSLKARIQDKFTGKPDAELTLAKHEEKPEVWEAPLKEALVEADVDQDQPLIEAAQKLLELVNPQQAAMGKYNVQITGDVQGFVQGDNAHVEMTFGGDKPKEK